MVPRGGKRARLRAWRRWGTHLASRVTHYRGSETRGRPVEVHRAPAPQPLSSKHSSHRNKQKRKRQAAERAARVREMEERKAAERARVEAIRAAALAQVREMRTAALALAQWAEKMLDEDDLDFLKTVTKYSTVRYPL